MSLNSLPVVSHSDTVLYTYTVYVNTTNVFFMSFHHKILIYYAFLQFFSQQSRVEKSKFKKHD